MVHLAKATHRLHLHHHGHSVRNCIEPPLDGWEKADGPLQNVFPFPWDDSKPPPERLPFGEHSEGYLHPVPTPGGPSTIFLVTVFQSCVFQIPDHLSETMDRSSQNTVDLYFWLKPKMLLELLPIGRISLNHCLSETLLTEEAV